MDYAAGGKRALGTRTPCNPRAQGEPWESLRIELGIFTFLECSGLPHTDDPQQTCLIYQLTRTISLFFL